MKFHASTAILNDIGIGKSPKCLIFWKDHDQRSIDCFAPNLGLPERCFRGTEPRRSLPLRKSCSPNPGLHNFMAGFQVLRHHCRSTRITVQSLVLCERVEDLRVARTRVCQCVSVCVSVCLCICLCSMHICTCACVEV